MFALMLMAALSAPISSPVEDASADDCAIVVAIGRAEAAWGSGGPNLPFVVGATDAAGVLYRQRCPRRKLGVGPPIVAAAEQPVTRFAVARPIFGQGRRTAEADFYIVGPGRPGGVPFTSVKHCSLRKEHRRWRLLSCIPGPIT